MELSAAQVDEYGRNGFLFCPGLLSAAEMGVLQRALDRITQTDRREIIREKDGRTLRSVFNMQAYDEAFARLVRHPGIIKPVTQLLGGPTYVFQLILNLKRAFAGDPWPWHQDYPTYHFDDGLPQPRMVNVLIFVDEVNEFNGPLMLVPGTHLIDYPLPEIDTKKTSYPLRALPEQRFAEHARARGIVAPKGPPGSIIFMHTNLVHGSASNMSPWNRSMMSLTINALDNQPTKPSRRPDFVVPSDRTPLAAAAPDCLVSLAQ